LNLVLESKFLFLQCIVMLLNAWSQISCRSKYLSLRWWIHLENFLYLLLLCIFFKQLSIYWTLLSFILIPVLWWVSTCVSTWLVILNHW
jgi:hypothetical protein